MAPYITRANLLGKLSNMSLEKVTGFRLGQHQRIELSLETLAGHARREATVPSDDGCQEGAEEKPPPPLPAPRLTLNSLLLASSPILP